MATENPHISDLGRVEIDTSAPFESVKEAATRFGGMGFWKPVSDHAYEHESEVVNVVELEEQTAQLERDLIVKERETLGVLNELETTKNIIEELKLKLQKETSEINASLKAEQNINAKNLVAQDQRVHQNVVRGMNLCPSEAPGFILLELKRAKLNLTKTSSDLAHIRATVDVYNKKIEKERASLEKTRQRLSSKLNDNDPINIARELQKLSSETEQFRRVGEAAKSQVQRAVSEIKQTKSRIRTAEIRLIAAKKLKEAARASEAVAFAEMKALAPQQISKEVTLTLEEYSSLISRAQEEDISCKEKVANAMILVHKTNASKTEILKKVEEATEEVKTSKRALKEALSRVEAANQGKLAFEKALRVLRSEHGHKRRSVHSCTKFKNPSLPRNNSSHLLDVNSTIFANDELKQPVLKPTPSIGQILSRKMMLTEECENGMQTNKVSLGQMLSRPSSDQHSARKSGKEDKELPVKRKKFGFARISLLVAKQSKKKNNSCICSKFNVS